MRNTGFVEQHIKPKRTKRSFSGRSSETRIWRSPFLCQAGCWSLDPCQMLRACALLLAFVVAADAFAPPRCPRAALAVRQLKGAPPRTRTSAAGDDDDGAQPAQRTFDPIDILGELSTAGEYLAQYALLGAVATLLAGVSLVAFLGQ